MLCLRDAFKLMEYAREIGCPGRWEKAALRRKLSPQELEAVAEGKYLELVGINRALDYEVGAENGKPGDIGLPRGLVLKAWPDSLPYARNLIRDWRASLAWRAGGGKLTAVNLHRFSLGAGLDLAS